MLKVVPNQKFIWLTVLVKDLHLFRSQFLNLLQIPALMLLLFKNFQGCIVVYLSRFILILSNRLEICFAHFLLCCIGNFDRISHQVAFVNNFFQVFYFS